MENRKPGTRCTEREYLNNTITTLTDATQHAAVRDLETALLLDDARRLLSRDGDVVTASRRVKRAAKNVYGILSPAYSAIAIECDAIDGAVIAQG